MAGDQTKTGGRRVAKPRKRPLGGIIQMPWRQIINSDRPVEPLDDEAVEAILGTAMRILAEIGVEMLNADARRALATEGCDVVGERVRMGAEFICAMLARAPEGFTLTPRNPARAVTVGGQNLAFAAVASPAQAWDLERGLRVGDFATFREFLKLAQAFDCIHMSGGYPVEPADIDPETRHLDCLAETLTLTDKVVHAYCLGAAEVEDAMEMVRLAAGLGAAEFAAAPRMLANINPAAPLRYDALVLDGAMRLARNGQPVIITPVTLAGAMAPATLAGAVALAMAEALAALALVQVVAPGAPVAVGCFVAMVDPGSGTPLFGTPEQMRATQMMAQLVRRCGLPFRASGTSSANVPDGQAMWETAQSLWSSVQAGAHMVFHAAGWLAGGQIASPEKFVMDCEVLQAVQRYCEPALTAAAETDLAFAAIKAAGPGGTFFAPAPSPAAPSAAPHRPFLADWRSPEAWAADGKPWTSERAHRIYKQVLADFTAPPLADADGLARFVAGRKARRRAG